MFRHLPPTSPYLTGPALAAAARSAFGGPATIDAFAESLARYTGAPGAFLASTGRTALYLALKELAHQHADRREVILPAYTCPVLVTVLEAAQLTPRLCDVDPNTFDFDRDYLRRLISERTLAVIPVHPNGIPQEVRDVIALADEQGAVVIEDAAQSLGARLHGRSVGTRGRFGLISLGPGKALSTGSGGFLLCNRDDDRDMLARIWRDLPSPSRMRSVLAVLGIAALKFGFHPMGWWLTTRLGINRIGDSEATWGFKLNKLTTTQAGMGRALLAQLDTINAARRERAACLIEALNDAPAIRFPKIAPGADPIYVRLPVLVSGAGRRDQLFDALHRQGISAGKMYNRPLNVTFPQMFRSNEDYPGAATIAAQLLVLPTHRFVTDGDIARIANAARHLSSGSSLAKAFEPSHG
jgi:dTDP-4-amino-4,6-dideoxygalactose transaminase